MMTYKEKKFRHNIKIGLLIFAIIVLGILVYKDVSADQIMIPTQAEFNQVTPNYSYRATVTKVVDGDTFEAIVELGLGISYKIKVRVQDLDTPEVRGAKSDCERSHAESAKVFATTFLTHESGVILKFPNPYKMTFDRYEADVYVLNGYRYATVMIASGMEKYQYYNGVESKYFKPKRRIANLKATGLSEDKIIKWRCGDD